MAWKGKEMTPAKRSCAIFIEWLYKDELQKMFDKLGNSQ